MELAPQEPAPRGSVLIVEDDELARNALRRNVAEMGFAVHEAEGVSDGIDQLCHHQIDVALVDLQLPGGHGQDVLTGAPAAAWHTDFVMVTGKGDPTQAAACLEAGASDYLQKPVERTRLQQVVMQGFERSNFRRESNLPRNSEPEYFFVGNSEAMRRLQADIRRYGPSNAPVMIYGESGTGKDLVARALHEVSGRSGSFAAINCGSLAGTVLEGELFGWKRGSFTGASTDGRGKLAMAANGTLLLDEIGDMPRDFQVKILRAVEDNLFYPVGDTRGVPLTARLLGATHRDLERAVRENRFRHDLRYRLEVAKIHIPALRERVEDISPLTWRFVHEFNLSEGRNIKRVTEDALHALERYPWPGNIRQLRNALNVAVLHTDGEDLTAEMLPREIVEGGGPAGGHSGGSGGGFGAELMDMPYSLAKRALVDGFTPEYLKRQLERSDGVVARAARASGMESPNFHRLLRKYGLKTPK